MSNLENKQKIEQQCKDWTAKNISPEFTFREHQLEYIVDVIIDILEENIKTNAVEAPTGSGKSLIAIITCGVLWNYYNKRSYILVSDLGLIEQYTKDITDYGLDWGIIIGQDNYKCTRNDNVFSQGECKLNMVPYYVLQDNKLCIGAGYDCAFNCKYIQARKKAMSSPVTLMTYQFFLIQRNYIASISEEDKEPFGKRDLVVCDEAHKLNEIIQSQYSPVIDDENATKIDMLLKYAEAYGLYPSAETIAQYKFRDKVFPELHDFGKVSKLISTLEDTQTIYNALIIYLKHLNYLADINQQLLDIVKESDPELRKTFKKQLFFGAWANELHNKFKDYIELIGEVGHKYIIKNGTPEKITLNCIYEDRMVDKYFHKVSGNELLMSATLGNPEVYKRSIGASNFKHVKIPSTFDFTKSPIYFLNKYKMSYKEKEASLPHVCNQIEKICKGHKKHRGIIQTGSYDFMHKLYKSLSVETKKRIFMYSESSEKNDVLKKFNNSENGVLIGPTLLEGLNFPDSMCRFIICMKLPYASLGDKLVKAKLSYLKGWYEANVCSKLEQGIGRGVRHKSDWCITYILDACFNDILTRSRTNLSSESLARITLIEEL